jgi:hypothetical protein
VELCRNLLRNLILQRLIGVLCHVLVGSHLLSLEVIFKKGDKHLPENYRPVSLTSVTSKILEHNICRHLFKHLEKNKILTNLNHGFRSGYSCETQLLTTINDFLQEHDKGHQLDVAILDFSKDEGRLQYYLQYWCYTKL